jgi:hypothetical protein
LTAGHTGQRTVVGAVRAVLAGTTVATVAADAEVRPGDISAGAAVTSCFARRVGITAGTAVTGNAVAGVTTSPAGIAVDSGAAVTAITVGCRPAVTAHAGGIGGPVAAIAEKQPAITTSGLGQRPAIHTIGAVADQKLVGVK